MKIKIEDISYTGAGVGRVNGKVVFVPKVDIGEEAEIDVTFEKSTYMNGCVKSILKKSESREDPPCKYYDKCHGCDFQHVTYAREIELKKLILTRELSKLLSISDIQFVTSSRYRYRNKIKLSCKENKIGYFAGDDFIEIDDCLLADEKIATAIKDIKEFLLKNKINTVKNIIFRSCDDGVLIVFLLKKREKIDFSALYKYKIYTAVGEILESNKTAIYDENDQRASKKIGDKEIRLEPKAFFQVNDNIAEKLYSEVAKRIYGEVVINAYSGQGILSNILAENAKTVIGIEVDSSAHEIAEKIKQKNVINYLGKVEDKISDIIKKYNPTSIVLDPARAGCDKKVINSIINSKIKNIIYISCNFSCLIRDINLLKNKYKIKNIIAFDMFPNTANVEVMAQLEII